MISFFNSQRKIRPDPHRRSDGRLWAQLHPAQVGRGNVPVPAGSGSGAAGPVPGRFAPEPQLLWQADRGPRGRAGADEASAAESRGGLKFEGNRWSSAGHEKEPAGTTGQGQEGRPAEPSANAATEADQRQQSETGGKLEHFY